MASKPSLVVPFYPRGCVVTPLCRYLSNVLYGGERDRSMKTTDEVKNFLNTVISECRQEYKDSYREVCIGLEAAMLSLHEEGTSVLRIAFDYHKDGISVAEVELTDSPPSDYTLVGVWTVLYSTVMPRFTAFGPEPLRVSRLEIGYGIEPRVTYDTTYDIGLPLALNRPYSPDKLKVNMKR